MSLQMQSEAEVVTGDLHWKYMGQSGYPQHLMMLFTHLIRPSS
jgi:hypothetical protein